MDRHGIFDLDLVGDGRLGIADQRDIGRGAAHVVGDEVVEAGALARIGGGDDAGGRARHHGLCRIAGDEAGRDHAAIAVHDQEVAGVAAPGKLAAQPLDIAFEDRLHRGVDRRRDAALELARFRQQRVAHGDVAVRPGFGGDLGGAALMRRVGVGMQEMDDQRLAAGVDQAANGSAHLVLVERRAHIARRFDALRHFEPEIARDDRHEDAGHAIGLRPRAAAELDDVAEAARGDHAGHRQPPLEHGVGRRRGAMDDQVDRLDREGGGVERGDHAMRLVVDGGRRLGDADLAVAAIDEDQVGEGAADVDAGDDASPGCAIFL